MLSPSPRRQAAVIAVVGLLAAALASAGAWVAVSRAALVDDVPDAWWPDTVDTTQTALEDGLKLVGIAWWATFALWGSRLLLTPSSAPPST